MQKVIGSPGKSKKETVCRFTTRLLPLLRFVRFFEKTEKQINGEIWYKFFIHKKYINFSIKIGYDK